ncbi:MAG: aminoacyl-tRNA hydrolase [Thermoanaerobaculales bacterium]|jgi:PTH1 family peptidyl-tRNA hydrolase|nr:aminoacyl-tRNA hydrolase [Thermoanaerobaculales bacterium]
MSIQLVLGLGNPGPRYVETRHNIGFRVVDELVRRHGDGDRQHHRLCDLATVDLGGGVLVARPLTYMNRSGDALAWLLDRLLVEPDETLVVVDDIDLPLGRLRLRSRGGPGTHNGLRHLVEVVGAGFPRLRVGVRGDRPWLDLADWVTSPFEDDERAAAALAVGRAADAVETVVRVGLDAAMAEVNRVETPE